MSSNEDEIVDLKSTIDWSREAPRRCWDPGRKLILSIRDYQKYRQRSGGLSHLLKKVAVFRHRFWSVITASDIPINSNIGGGLLLPHPNGIVLHPKAKIGINCLILQQVTIVSDVDVGNYVDFGAGAKVVRGVKIGDGATIGANSVVIHDVEADSVVVGAPARTVNKLSPEKPGGKPI